MKSIDELLDLLPVEIAVRDADGRYTLVNRAWEHSSGLKREQVLGRTAAELFPAQRARRIDESDREAIALAGKTVHSDISVRAMDEGYRYLAISKTAMHDATGKLIGVLTTATDMSARREVEQAFKEQVKLARDLIDANPIPIYLKDTKCRYVDVNPAFVKHTGLAAERIIGRTVLDVVSGERAQRHIQIERELLARGEGSSTTELQLPRPEGLRHYIMNKSVLQRSDGSVRGLLCSITDVTPLKHIEAELRASREEALQAARARAAFLATMSHEIRTPLNGVIGMTGVLLDTELSPEQRDYVETIRVSGEALLSVINDILDFSKIESGKLELETEPLELARVIEETFDMLGERARSKQLDLMYEMADDVPSHVHGDSTCLRQIVVNLVSNAIKFTDSGEILVGVRRRPAPEDGALVLEFRVADTGIGIPRERLHVLFEAFSQVDASTTRKYGGTGLGLAICKRLVELMGGEIMVESEPGRGSTFTFTVRCTEAPAPADAPPLAGLDIVAGKRILIVDDNANNLRILDHQLKRWGIRAERAVSGKAALDLLSRGMAFDAAIVDYQMPEMNGVTLAQTIRRDASHGRLPVILLSSAASHRVKGRSLFVVQLLKPARQSQLFDALVTALTGKRPAAGAATHVHAPLPVLARRLPLSVLVVDDHEVNCTIAKLLLKKLGYKADTAGDGRQALNAVKRKRYDIVFMDVQMPEPDGFEATRAIRDRLGDERPVIVAMTADAMEGDREACLAAGMDDYVSKPLAAATLQNVLERWGGMAAERAVAVSPGLKSKNVGDRRSVAVIDWSRLREIGEFDDERGSMIHRLIQSFVSEGKMRTAAIRNAALRRDSTALASAAHALKGAALNVGAAQLAVACGSIESRAREGRTAGFAPLIAALTRRFNEASQLLRKDVLQNHRRREGTPPAVKKSKRRSAGRGTRSH
jgi:PAS domain S-box-containing protein